MADAQFDAALDLLRRLSPLHITRNLTSLTTLVPDLTEDLLSAVDTPLQSRRDPKSQNRDYLLCDYNRDGDSYRSPWSNEFSPPVPEDSAVYPSERVRKMEIAANESFDVYRQMYFEGGASTGSVYFWDLDEGFAGVVLLKKTVPAAAGSGKTGGGGAQWDSIHVFEAQEAPGSTVSNYKLTSTVILHLSRQNEVLGEMTLSGSMTRQVERAMAVEIGKDETHVANVGTLVEDMEGKMRNLLQEVYFGKAKDVVGDLRSIQTLSEANRDRQAHRDVISNMSR